jgi:hypothetical protein
MRLTPEPADTRVSMRLPAALLAGGLNSHFGWSPVITANS